MLILLAVLPVTRWGDVLGTRCLFWHSAASVALDLHSLMVSVIQRLYHAGSVQPALRRCDCASHKNHQYRSRIFTLLLMSSVTVFHHTFAHFPSVIDSFWVVNRFVERGLRALRTVEELIELLYCVVDQMVTSTTCGVQRMKPWWRWLKTVQRFDVHFCKCLWRLSHVRLKQLQWYWWMSLTLVSLRQLRVRTHQLTSCILEKNGENQKTNVT